MSPTSADSPTSRPRKRSKLERNSSDSPAPAPGGLPPSEQPPPPLAAVPPALPPPPRFEQVTALSSSYKLPFHEADVYYVPDFVPDVEKQQRWYDGVLKFEGWYQPKLKMYGREITQSRKIAAFATDPALVLKYSGQTVNMSYDYPPLLREIQDEVEQLLRVRFNHCMLNHYDDGSVYIGKHRDNKENKVIASLSLGAERTFIMTHDAPPGSVAATKLEARAQAAAAKARDTHAKRRAGKKGQSHQSKDGDEEKQGATGVQAATGSPCHVVTDASDSLVYERKWKLSPGSLVVMQGDTQKRWKHEIPREKGVKAGRVSLTFRQLEYD